MSNNNHVLKKDQFNLEMWKKDAPLRSEVAAPNKKGTVLRVILNIFLRFPTLVEWIMEDVFDILPTLGNLPLLKQITSTQSPQQSSKNDHVHPSIGIPITDSSLTA